MTVIVADRERRKAAFLTEYKTLCRKHGMMVIQVTCDDYSPMSVADLCEDPASLDKAVGEMLIEPLRTIEWPTEAP